MYAILSFQLPEDPEQADLALERLNAVFQFINEDKEEQAIDPDNHAGNLDDYPDWLKNSFADRGLIKTLEKFNEYEPGELDGQWDLETWYEDLLSCETFNYRIERDPGGLGYMLFVHVSEEHYGGDQAHAWVLMAAGARKVRLESLVRETQDDERGDDESDDDYEKRIAQLNPN